MTTSNPIHRGLGITASLDTGLARDLAVACEQLGYHSLWSNDEPAAPGLETLAQVAAAAPHLELGVGALPLDRHQPVRIAADINRLGGAIADGVLLNWMLPTQTAQARRWAQDGADEAGRTPPVVTAYIRVAVGPGSARRLRNEEDYYRNINDGHRTHFEAMNAPLGSVGVAASARPEVLAALAPYHAALDLPIARLLTANDASSLHDAALAAAP